LRKRRFNQSFLLARSLSTASGVPVAPHVLARVRDTSTQGGLSAKGRARNVAGAFKVRPRWVEAVQTRRMVIVDDVHTTGATLSACARALMRAGAEDVSAITLARVVKPVDPLK
jgi:ComF family protein